MNLLDNLMSKFAKKDDAEPVFDPAEAKAERIKLHRTQVRNGPVSFKSGTHPRRQQAIDAKSSRRKAKKRHFKDFHTSQASTASLRGRLQAANALPYADENFRPSLELRTNALLGLIGEFGVKPEPAELTNEYIEDAVAGAVATYETLSVR